MKKKKFEFPTAFTVLFIILILASVLTYVVPSGSFDRLTYNSDTKEFVVSNHEGIVKTLPATQEELNKLNIQLELSKFEDGTLKKPIAIPNTYVKIPQQPQGFFSVIEAPIKGIMDTVDIMIFVLLLGGVIGLVNKVGAFDAGISVLSKKTKGKEFILVALVFILTTLGGTTFGLAEETIAFYPILMPIFLISGFDAITCIAAIYMGSAIGTMFSTVNPFSVVIASNAAGISFASGLNYRIGVLIVGALITLAYMYWYARRVQKDPTKSLVYEEREEIKDIFLKDYDPNVKIDFTFRRKLIFIVFALAFIILVWGVARQGWWFEEMSSLFLVVGIIIMFLSGLPEKEAINTFIGGAADLVGVVLTIGLARSINIVMDNGMISDTLLNYSINAISGMSGSIFAVAQFVAFSFLGFFIPSSSGLAVLTMPIMAPLADSVGLPREIVINAYSWGQGLMSFITPTGLILVTLEMASTTFNKWLRYILPLMIIMGIYSIVALIFSIYI